MDPSSSLNIGGANKHKRVHKHMHHYHEQGWIAWIMQNRLMMIILLILFVIIVVPWLICDVLGLRFICDIISGIFSLIKKIFGLFNLY